MFILLKIACQVIARRIAAGEVFANIMQDYPRMTEEQTEIVKKKLKIDVKNITVSNAND